MSMRDIDTDDTGLPMPGREHDPPRSQALEVPAPVANQTLTAAPDLVERLSESSWNASAPDMWRFVPDYRKDVHRAHVRAVLAELAAMGREALPTRQAVFDAITGHFALDSQVRDVCDLYAHVAPALAAKDATIAEQAREIERISGLREDYKLMATSGDPRVVRARNAALLKCNIDRDRVTQERDAALAELRARVAEDERVESEGPDVGCGDSSCVVAPPKGQSTNGRCRCGPHKLRMVVKVLRTYREAGLGEIEKLEAVVKGLRAKVVELERAAREGLT